ncbi:hypothetical protein DYBT9275_03963 [Dyadobacter sp. CECT 9275]|uniref:Gingipain domain-containing protein n=1 Tax=Dyadobacter helix TaxID=2822344 RepID=A0A916JEE6_9BACT|nr:C25 family cysteine peptidase [Dyadobacter sp. CECT 9275]CAG5007098.1 hypothetical protein DYBT9275_03963 [Dyadobacter sp. CECT 9275]
MNFGEFKLIVILLFLCAFNIVPQEASAQDLTPWTDYPYGNQWIDYSKKYVRVGVTANGIYSVNYTSLTNALKKTESDPAAAPESIQLWHRGKEVAIISANTTEIVFYGEKNDGVSDGLMFRPNPEARLNKYVSFFSEAGAYFFTTASGPSRVSEANGNPVSSVTAEPFHYETYIKKFDDYSELNKRNNQKFSFTTFMDDATLNHSYYTAANSWTSPLIYGPNTGKSPQSYPATINLKNWVSSAATKPVFEIVVNGHNTGYHEIQVFMGADEGSVESHQLGSSLSFTGYGGLKLISDLTESSNLTSGGTGYLKVKSVSTSTADDFGISYYSVLYPQVIDMTGLNNCTFNFKTTANSESIIEILNVAADTKVYDISNPYQPVLITNGIFANNNLKIQVQRVSGKTLNLLVVAPSYVKGSITKINAVSLGAIYQNARTATSPTIGTGAINPEAFDYLIITNNDEDPNRAGERDLRLGAKAYAENYRSKVEGGSFNTLVMDIRSIYDQFNYGEPSAIAIRRFVDYMIQNGVRPKHNLVLMGYSVTIPINITKELAGEVPSFGDPGSDILLVTGLSNSPNVDIPAIPVGRINAFNKTELANYLTKVIEYERQTNNDDASSLSWRKNIVHLIGAKRKYELPDFKDVFTGVSSHVLSLDGTRQIKTLSNDAIATSDDVDAVNTPAPTPAEVNAGAGMIAYYGHGNQAGTIYNIRNVNTSDFTVNNKFSFIYFNGCGVGNIFTSGSVQMLSTDWLITPGKGSVVIFGNSYKSYVSPTKIYIDLLYRQIFLKTDQTRPTIGQILLATASTVINDSPDTYETTNIHQTNLYGDPAIRILNTTPPTTLPVDLVKFDVELSGDNKVKLTWSTSWEKNNSHFEVERSYNARNFETIGRVEGKGDITSLTQYQFYDNRPYGGINYYRLKQVDIEGTKSGNYSRIISVNVENIKPVVVYPNPSNDQMEIGVGIPTDIRSWKIINSSGQVIKTGLGKNVSVRNIRVGNYVLEILTNANDIFRSNFVKE